MKIRILFIICIMLGLTACLSSNSISEQKEMRLIGYHWNLQTATDSFGKAINELIPDSQRPLTFDFTEDRLSISGGCNQLSTSYEIKKNILETGAMMSTLRACRQELMKADEVITRIMSEPLTINMQLTVPPRLTLTSSKGETLNFVGNATAETLYGSSGERVFLEVAAFEEPCSHPLIPNKQCLKVREIYYDANGVKGTPGEWSYLYEDIEGYSHVEGIRNILRLKKFTRTPTPADASSIVYVLDMVVESETINP